MPYTTLKIRQSLKSIGFSDNEIRVLLFLLKQKKSTAREVSKDTMISFCSVEYALSSLVGRKIAHIKNENGEDIFQVISEKNLLSWIEDQKHEHQKIYEDAKLDITHFFQLVSDTSWKPDVTYYEGQTGIREIYEDILKFKHPIYGWSDLEKKIDILGKEYAENYAQRRIKAKIHIHTIKPRRTWNEQDKQSLKSQLKEIKLVDHLPMNGEVRIYGNKVALIKYDLKKPVGFVFEGEWVRTLFQSLFDSAWQN